MIIYHSISLSLSVSVFVCVCAMSAWSMAWHVSLICFKDLQASFNAETAKSIQKPLW